jgi:4-hydroxybenzoate polyprenyltransferase
MAKFKVSATDVAFGYVAPTERLLRNQVIGFVTLQRIAVVVLYFPTLAAVAALAGTRFDDPRFIVLLGVTWLIGAGGNAGNDLVDVERDKAKWPLRPLPTGLISKPAAALYVALLLGIGFLITVIVFNGLAAAVLLSIIVLGYVYARYARDNIGYLTLVIPVSLLPIAIWAAISPETILTPLPWLLAAYSAAVTAFGNVANEATDRVAVKALFVHFKPFTEVMLYVVGAVCAFVLGAAIILYAHVSLVALVVLIIVTAFTLSAARYLGSNRSPETLKKAFKTVFLSLCIFSLTLAVFVWFK